MTTAQERDLLRAKLADLRKLFPYPEALAGNLREVAHLIGTSTGPSLGISKKGLVDLLVQEAEKVEALRDIISPPENINRAQAQNQKEKNTP